MVANKKMGTHTGKGKPAMAAKKPTAKSHPVAEAKDEITLDRRANRERRHEVVERRTQAAPAAAEQRVLQRRIKVSRRRQIDPTTCERDYSGEEIEFMSAMDNYKRRSGRMFPTCSEVLEVIRDLGYQRLKSSENNTPAISDSMLSIGQ
jgi:hypothetical protein